MRGLDVKGRGWLALPDELRQGEARGELDPGLLFLAWQLAALAPGCSPEERRALIFLGAALLLNGRRGSTRLPLDGPALGGLLEDLSAPTSDRETISRLLEEARRREGAFAAIVGSSSGPSSSQTPASKTSSALKPLLIEGEQLYFHRMFHAEQELIKALLLRMKPVGAPGAAYGEGRTGGEPEGQQEAKVGQDAAAREEGMQDAAAREEGDREAVARDAGDREAVAREAGERLRFSPEAIEGAVREVAAAPPVVRGEAIELSDEQLGAITRALGGQLTVISGGPGTGKTSIVVSVLRALSRLDCKPERIAIAAPTGKAANRLAESIRSYLSALAEPGPLDRALIDSKIEPRTLHRLLGWSPSRSKFRHQAHNPLPADVVIVDEASMIDLEMMGALLGAVHPEAKLVLLGDAEQLPSVDAGAVLRDLLPAGSAPDRRSEIACRLTKSYRMDPNDPAGRNILSIARAINEGEVGALFEAEEPITFRAAVEDVFFQKVELLDAQGASFDTFLDRWHREAILGLPGFDALVRREYHLQGGAFSGEDEAALQRLFRHFEGHRILCVTRGNRHRSGADSVNEALHRRAAATAKATVREGGFLPGEPVMMQRNDYARGLFNGDQGLVLRVREGDEEGHRFRAVFPSGGGFHSFSLEGLRNQLRHSYAMTIHKSQGSEFDVVALLLPDTPMPLLSREILYTGVTRARKGVLLVGSRPILEFGVRRRLERHSGIGERLA